MPLVLTCSCAKELSYSAYLNKQETISFLFVSNANSPACLLISPAVLRDVAIYKFYLDGNDTENAKQSVEQSIDNQGDG